MVVREGDDEAADASRDAAGAAGRREGAPGRGGASGRSHAWCSGRPARGRRGGGMPRRRARRRRRGGCLDADADADASDRRRRFPAGTRRGRKGSSRSGSRSAPPRARRVAARARGLGGGGPGRVAPNAAVAACGGEAALGALVACAVAALAADDAEHRTAPSRPPRRVSGAPRRVGGAGVARAREGALARTRAALASVRNRNGGGNRGGCRGGMVAGAVGVPPRSARGRTISSALRFGSPGDATSATGTRSATRSRASSGTWTTPRGRETRGDARGHPNALPPRGNARGFVFLRGRAGRRRRGRRRARGGTRRTRIRYSLRVRIKESSSIPDDITK